MWQYDIRYYTYSHLMTVSISDEDNFKMGLNKIRIRCCTRENFWPGFFGRKDDLILSFSVKEKNYVTIWLKDSIPYSHLKTVSISDKDSFEIG